MGVKSEDGWRPLQGLGCRYKGLCSQCAAGEGHTELSGQNLRLGDEKLRDSLETTQ